MDRKVIVPYKDKADQAAWFQKNKEKVYKKRKEYYKSWDIISYSKKYRENNISELKQYIKAWQKQNPEKLKSIKAKRRAAKLNRTPKWLTKSDFKEISKFYLDCPKGYEVDHIIPLQGDIISGLHVLSNLQYLTIKDNRSKGNRFLK